MGLTSATFTWLMIAAAIGALGLLAGAWPRRAAAGRRGPGMAGRRVASMATWLAALAVTQVLVIAAFLVWLNGYFDFYGSWAQLLGTSRAHPAPVAAAPALPTTGVLISHSGPGPSPWGGKITLAAPPGALAGLGPSGAPADVGEVLQVAFRGQRTGLPSGATYVYLPPQYFQRAYAREQFPVVLTLTGFPGEAIQLVHRLAIPELAARLIAEGRIRPAVFVMMNVSPLLPVDTECTDIPSGPQVESFFAQDVPQAIERAFRVTSSASGWGVVGYSTGGYCAAKLAMMYPARFSAAVSMAGYYDAEGVPGLRHQWGASTAYRNENSPDWRLRHLPAPPVSVLATSSRVGEPSLPGTLAFLRLIHPPMRGYSLLVPLGGHNFGTWARELPPSLVWLSAQLR